MTDRATETSPQPYARAAGALYLVIIVFGIWSEVFVRGSLIVTGDATETATNVLAAEGLFRASFAADTLMALSDVALAVLLYHLLRPVNATLALTAAALRLVQTAVIAASLLHQYSALLILNGAGNAATFQPAELHALVALASFRRELPGSASGALVDLSRCWCLVIRGHLSHWQLQLFLFPAHAETVAPLTRR